MQDTLTPTTGDTAIQAMPPGRDITPLDAAKEDLLRSVIHPRIWATVGWMDIKQRYRRSTLGPFWITLSVAMFIFGLGVVYGGLLGLGLAEYMPYLGIGMIVWLLISGLITEGCSAFTGAEAAIKQVPIPLSTHVFRTVWRNLIVFAHHCIILVILLVMFPQPIGWSALLAIPGLLLVSLFGLALAGALGILSARFRDIPIMIANLVQLVFFTTPILWNVDTLPENRRFIAQINPVHYLISLVRDPLLGKPPPAWYWLVGVVSVAVALGIAYYLFTRYRARIAYWV